MAPDKSTEGGTVIHAWNANRQGLNPTELVHKPNNGPCSECGSPISILGDYGYWLRSSEDEYTWVPRCFGCYRRNSNDYHSDRTEAPVHG